MIINVMAVPGNGQFQPEGGIRDIPQMTVSQDEGFALRDRLGAGETVNVTLHLNVPELTNVQTAYTIATLPGASTRRSWSSPHRRLLPSGDRQQFRHGQRAGDRSPLCGACRSSNARAR